MGLEVDKKLKDVLSGISAEDLKKSKASIEQLLSTPQGKNLIDKLSNVDKNKILDTFMKMDTNQMKEKLKNVDLSKISQSDAMNIINKLK